MASSLALRAIALVAPLILIPFALRTIGSERYGLWTAAAALTSMALFADLGLGNGLMTKLTKAYAESDIDESKRLIASAYAMTGAIALGLSIVIVAGVSVLSPASWLDKSGAVPPDEANSIILLCLLAFAVNVPLSLITRVQYAHQQVTYSNFWTAASSIASVVAFVSLTELGASPVTAIGGAVFAIPAVAVLNTLFFFGIQQRSLSPFSVRPDVRHAAALLRLGGQFLVLAVLTSVTIYVDPLLIARQLGLDASAEYAVGWRVAGTLGLLVTLVNLPLWPANGEALAKGDVRWVRKATLRMSLLSAGLVAVGGIVLLGPGRSVVDLWLSDSGVTPSTGLLSGLVVWNLLLAVVSPITMIQNSVGVVWPQLLAWSLYLPISFAAKWTAIGTFGVAGAPWAAAASYFVLVVPLLLLGARLTLRRAARQHPPGQPAELTTANASSKEQS